MQPNFTCQTANQFLHGIDSSTDENLPNACARVPARRCVAVLTRQTATLAAFHQITIAAHLAISSNILSKQTHSLKDKLRKHIKQLEQAGWNTLEGPGYLCRKSSSGSRTRPSRRCLLASGGPPGGGAMGGAPGGIPIKPGIPAEHKVTSHIMLVI